MIRTFRAELARLTSRRGMLAAGLVLLVVGLGGPAVVFASAKPAAEQPPGSSFAPTIESLSAAGGGTQVFRYAAAFAGTLVFVVFTGLFAAEQARGTYRTMLLRQPRRLGLLAGKFGALVTYATVLLALIEVLMWVAGRFEAANWQVSTSSWTGVDALGSVFVDLGTVLIWVVGYAVYGLTLAVLLRSLPLALAVGIAWAGPIEHLVSDSWAAAHDWFPGLLLEAVGQGGTNQVSLARAVLTSAAYVVVAALATATAFRRRDITA
jgi:ABC-2 type transport system permease protein